MRAASQSVDFEKKLFEIPVNNVDENIVSEAIKSGQFISYLKLYLIDHLRRCATFKDVKAFTHTLTKKENVRDCSELEKALRTLQEREIIISFIEAIPVKSQPQIGYLIALNDYPVPMLYPEYDDNCKKLVYKTNFHLFDYLIRLSSKYLALVSGTSNT